MTDEPLFAPLDLIVCRPSKVLVRAKIPDTQAEAVLNSLMANVAVLTADGTILPPTIPGIDSRLKMACRRSIQLVPAFSISMFAVRAAESGDAADETRYRSYEPHSSVLDDLELVASLDDLAKDFAERTGIV